MNARSPEAELLRAVFDSVGAGMFVIDTEGCLSAVNPWAERIVGRPAERMLGRDLHDLLHRGPDGAEVPREKCRVLTVLDRGQPTEGSSEFYLRGDGGLVPIIWAATPLQCEGRMEGAVVVFHNFKKHRDAAEQTAAHLAALEELTARLSMVAEVSVLLTSTVDMPEMLGRLVRLLVPELGDWAVIDLVADDRAREVRRVAAHAVHDPGADASLTGPLPPLPEDSRAALVRALHGARPVPLDARDPDEPLVRAQRPLFDRLGGDSAVVVPLHTRRQLFGALTVARGGERSAYRDAEVLVLGDIARRAGLVMESLQLFERQRHVAETLQRQLLTPLPRVDHIRLAARYRPAQQAAEVGGDWYDAFLLGDGVMAMVIGDVVGHDLQAAAHMAEVRNMLRALAWDRQEPPSLIMRRLDEAVTHTSDAPMATAVFARLEGPEGGPWHLHWVNAGHPPPLLVTSDGQARYLEDGHGPLLGLSGTLGAELDWPDVREEIPAESTLLMYTDGLVESRDHSLDAGLANLRRHAAALADRDVEGFLDGLLARIGPAGDDVALLALRLPRAGTGAEDGPPPPGRAHNPAAAGRGAPGSRVEGTPVEDASEPG
ncbi:MULTISPECIES: SpoIIE family protein phosphatase [unclassified Nocardiopsis]|uniref:SpoIIE family protein phosphatase n=1 Tax=unclassified Nocardiopsis TaxID=2649073 RepID=UPI00135A519D|nr:MULTISPECIES: SpoIIE family protein phosphatase [unclassified Nocardiopsis]